MNDSDKIKELFSKKFGNMEVKVDPALWNNIASQIGTSAAATTSVGLTITTKIVIATSIAASVITGSYFFFSNEEPQQNPVKPSETVTVDKTNEVLSEKIDQNTHINKGDVELNNRNKQAILVENRVENVNPTLQTDQMQIKEEPFILAEESTEIIQSKDKIPSIDNKPVLIENNSTTTIPVKTEPVVLPTANEYNEVNIELPNVFTPNGDNSNDVFEIINKDEGLGDYFVEFDVVIFNSNGEVIRTFKGYNFEWDGIDQRNEIAPDGMYSCMIIAENRKGGEPTKIFRSFELCRGNCKGY